MSSDRPKEEKVRKPTYEELLAAFTFCLDGLSCNEVPHRKKEQHDWKTPCPVMARLYALADRAYDSLGKRR